MRSFTKILKNGLTGIAFALLATSAHAAEGPAIKMVPNADVAKLPGIAFDKKLADRLPPAIKDKKVLKVATDLTPPISFQSEDGKLIGIDPDQLSILRLEADRRRQVRRHLQDLLVLDGSGQAVRQCLVKRDARQFGDVCIRHHLDGGTFCGMDRCGQQRERDTGKAVFETFREAAHAIPF